jgi:hypothetical protein
MNFGAGLLAAHSCDDKGQYLFGSRARYSGQILASGQKQPQDQYLDEKVSTTELMRCTMQRSVAQTKSWVLNFEQASPTALEPADRQLKMCGTVFATEIPSRNCHGCRFMVGSMGARISIANLASPRIGSRHGAVPKPGSPPASRPPHRELRIAMGRRLPPSRPKSTRREDSEQVANPATDLSRLGRALAALRTLVGTATRPPRRRAGPRYRRLTRGGQQGLALRCSCPQHAT